MRHMICCLAILSMFARCNNSETDAAVKQKADSMETKESKVVDKADSLPPRYATESANKRSKVIGWKKDQTPTAPNGFVVTRFADDLQHPRWICVADNGDVFVSQGDAKKGEAPNNILLFRDKDKDGNYETKTVFLKDLNMPFGMLVLRDRFYVGNTDAVVKYPYKSGETSITARGKCVADPLVLRC